MSMTKEQELILKAVDDPAQAKILCEIWEQIQNEPLAAARMIRSFQAATQMIDTVLKDIPAKWKELEDHLTTADIHRARFIDDLRSFNAGTMKEMGSAVSDLEKLQKLFLMVDNDKFLNRANQLLDLCDRLAQAKNDGSLEMLSRMMDKK